MPFINNVLSSKATGSVTRFSAGPDLATFCPDIITINGIVEGNLTGHEVKWEQVLKYQYSDVNIATNRIIVPGDISATFYGNREIIEIFNTSNGQGIGDWTVYDAVYNGVNTELYVLQPLPTYMGKVGVFYHAGSATNSLVWMTPTNQVTVQFDPTTSIDFRFRFWLDRGDALQEYDDMDVFLTPGHFLPSSSQSSSNNDVPQSFNSCRTASSFILPASTYTCTSTKEQDVTDWLLQFGWPTCDTNKLEKFIIQESLDGGSTWTEVYTSTVPNAVPVTDGSKVRIVTVYNEPGLVKPLVYEGPYNGILDYYFFVSPVIDVADRNNSAYNDTYVTDPICNLAHNGYPATIDPISGYTTNFLTALFLSWTDDAALDESITGASYSAQAYVDPITSIVTNFLVASYADWNDYPNLDYSTIGASFSGPSYVDPISGYTVIGDGIIIGG